MLQPVVDWTKPGDTIKFLRSHLMESSKHTNDFARRYHAKPKVYITIILGDNANMRLFQFKDKSAFITEFMRNGSTAKAFVSIGEQIYVFDSYLHAEIHVADYLSDYK